MQEKWITLKVPLQCSELEAKKLFSPYFHLIFSPFSIPLKIKLQLHLSLHPLRLKDIQTAVTAFCQVFHGLKTNDNFF